MINIEPIKGYDQSNYEKTKGISDDSFSILIVDQVVDLILEGWAYQTIANALCPIYHWNSYQMKFIYAKAMKELLNRSNKQSEDLKEKQLQRLLRLYRKCQDANDRKQELATLAEINKLNSLYVEKVELTNNEVVFRIDGEEADS